MSFPLFLFATYFFISYFAIVKNNQIISSKLNCSKALTNKPTISKKFIFTLDVEQTDIKKLCDKNHEKIVDKLFKQQIIVTNEYNKDYITKIIYLPKRFDIIIKNGFAYFYLKGD